MKRVVKIKALAAWCALLPVLAGCAPSGGYNSDHFDLTDWKIALPTAGKKGKAEEIKDLRKYESRYFYDGEDGAMVFMAPVGGSTTKGTKYPRSELRERDADHDAAWNLAQGGVMTATLAVDEIQTRADGKPGKAVVGQIHGEDNELIRLYWDNGEIYFKNDRAGKDNKEHKFVFMDAKGRTPSAPLGKKFSYRIDAKGDDLKVDVWIDCDRYQSVTKINPIWRSDILYFKAGIYLGDNAAQGARGKGQVSFYGLDFGHAPGAGQKGLAPQTVCESGA